jgi:hypothetical protein
MLGKETSEGREIYSIIRLLFLFGSMPGKETNEVMIVCI